MLRSLIAFTLILFTQLSHGANMQLQTTSFSKESPLAVVYTCDGKDVSPHFSWSEVPPNTASLAFIVADPDAPSGTFYHWALYNIPKEVTSLTEGNKHPPGVAAKNSWGATEYKGPCPPKGESHRYHFTLYALDTKLNLPAGADVNSVLDAMKDHILEKAELTTSYNR